MVTLTKINNGQHNNLNFLEKYWGRLLVLFIFLVHSSYLFFSTTPDKFDSLEFMKFNGTVITVIVMTFLSLRIYRSIIYLAAIIVIIVTILDFEAIISNASSSGRFISTSFGNNQGETGWAFAAAAALLMSITKIYNINKSILNFIIYFMFFLSMATLDRSTILFVGCYAVFQFWLIRFKILFYMLMIVIVLFILAQTFPYEFDQIIIRSSSPILLLTGRDEIWSEMINNFMERTEIGILFGVDYARHSIYTYRLYTPDAHNLFLEFLRTFGVFGLIYPGIYIYVNIFNKDKNNRPIVLPLVLPFIIMCLFESMIRMPMLPLLTAIYLSFILKISLDRIPKYI